MLTTHESRQLIRAGRFSNYRRFFAKDALSLLDEAQSIGLSIDQALHCAAPSLKAAVPHAEWTEQSQEQAQEMAQAIAESYGRDYDEGVQRTLELTGRAYSGD